jgi:hypothetical protein
VVEGKVTSGPFTTYTLAGVEELSSTAKLSGTSGGAFTGSFVFVRPHVTGS